MLLLRRLRFGFSAARARLAEHLHGKQEVQGSSPCGSFMETADFEDAAAVIRNMSPDIRHCMADAFDIMEARMQLVFHYIVMCWLMIYVRFLCTCVMVCFVGPAEAIVYWRRTGKEYRLTVDEFRLRSKGRYS